MKLVATRFDPRLSTSRPEGARRWQSVIVVCLGACLTLVAISQGGVTERLFGLVVSSVLAGGVVLLWSQGTRSGGWATLALGTAGVIVGIGIGARAISVGALDLTTVTSTLALPAGLAAIWLGLGRITAELHALWRILIGILAVALVAVTTWTVTPALIATNVPRIAPGDATPADFGFEASEVHFETEDGIRLWAWYASPPAGKVAIVRHGAGSTASDVLPQAKVMITNGYGVLITDARGHGRSEGVAMDFGWHGDRDIRAAVDFLATRPEVDRTRIVVVGLSMGGEEAIGAAASDSRIAAVVAEGATARTDADKVWLAKEYGWRGWVQTKLEWVQYTVTDVLTSAPKPTSLASAAAAMAPRQLLLITGGVLLDEFGAASHIQESAAGNVAVWTVAGAGHTKGLRVAPVEWETTVIGFLDSRSLGPVLSQRRPRGGRATPTRR